MKGLFVDTSAWIATLERGNPMHARVVAVLQRFPGRIYTSNYVFDEVVTLSRLRHGHRTAAALGKSIRTESDVHVLSVSVEDEEAAWQLFLQREDQPHSFTDCTSFVLMRRLDLEEVVTLDRDFLREGFRVLPAP